MRHRAREAPIEPMGEVSWPRKTARRMLFLRRDRSRSGGRVRHSVVIHPDSDNERERQSSGQPHRPVYRGLGIRRFTRRRLRIGHGRFPSGLHIPLDRNQSVSGRTRP